MIAIFVRLVHPGRVVVALCVLGLFLGAPAASGQIPGLGGKRQAYEIPFRWDKAVVVLPDGRDQKYKDALAEMRGTDADYSKAEKLLMDLVQNKDKMAEAWLALGVCREMLAKLDGASEAYKKAYSRGNDRIKEEADAGIARIGVRKKLAGKTS